MSLALVICQRFWHNREDEINFVFLPITATVGTTTPVAAPGTGRRIVVWDGNVGGSAGAITWHHTDNTAGNRLTAAQGFQPDKDSRVGPFVLPLNTPLVAVAGGNTGSGWICYSITD